MKKRLVLLAFLLCGIQQAATAQTEIYKDTFKRSGPLFRSAPEQTLINATWGGWGAPDVFTTIGGGLSIKGKGMAWLLYDFAVAPADSLLSLKLTCIREDGAIGIGFAPGPDNNKAKPYLYLAADGKVIMSEGPGWSGTLLPQLRVSKGQTIALNLTLNTKTRQIEVIINEKSAGSFTYPDFKDIDRFYICGFTDQSNAVLRSVELTIQPLSSIAESKVAETDAPEIIWTPAPLESGTRVQPDSIFGMCGHFLHTDEFFTGKKLGRRFDASWRLENTLPWLVNGNYTWIREPLYQSLFTTASNGTLSENGQPPIVNRKRVEDYLATYYKHGVKVMLCLYLKQGWEDRLVEFSDWVGELGKRFPNIRAFELHNEPNLKTFWRGTAREYVNLARIMATRLKAKAPAIPVVVGSFAGWGGAWNHAGLRDKKSSREIGYGYAEETFKLGLLEFADAVSAHPYRGPSAPEGGGDPYDGSGQIESPTDPMGFEKEVRGFLDLVSRYAPGNKRLPFYCTEIGWAGTGNPAMINGRNLHSLERQADYLSRMFLLFYALRLEGEPVEAVMWYDLKQDHRADGNLYESNIGLVSKNSGYPRPGWIAGRRITEFFANPALMSPAGLAIAPDFGEQSKRVKSYTWKRLTDNALILPFWRLNQLQKNDADFDTILTLALPDVARISSIILHDLHEDRPRPVGFSRTEAAIMIPLHVTARAAWLEINIISRSQPPLSSHQHENNTHNDSTSS
ncbi:hypothetical protein OpiT1DRAFT_02209 [Opitutaceae bacterium TAV1]|nr:hypothetical protein OpiT1DRAFT_02209 [Opitutaceae bacterium TAV1]